MHYVKDLKNLKNLKALIIAELNLFVSRNIHISVNIKSKTT